MNRDGFEHVWFGALTLAVLLGEYPMVAVHGDSRDGWWDLEFPDVPVAARFAEDVRRLGGVAEEDIILRYPDRVTGLWAPVTLSVREAGWSERER